MKRSILVALALCVAVAMPGMASAAVFLGFDELAAGTVLDTEYAGQGVVFSNSDGDLGVTGNWPGVAFTSPMAILPDNYYFAGNKSTATFSVLVTDVSVVLGDYDQDPDNIYLKLYDSGNNLIGSDTDFLEFDLYGGKVLSAAAPLGQYVAYAEFWGVGVNNNSVYFDNFRFEVDQQPIIPEPASLAVWSVLGAIGIAIAWYRRRRAA